MSEMVRASGSEWAESFPLARGLGWFNGGGRLGLSKEWLEGGLDERVDDPLISPAPPIRFLAWATDQGTVNRCGMGCLGAAVTYLEAWFNEDELNSRVVRDLVLEAVDCAFGSRRQDGFSGDVFDATPVDVERRRLKACGEHFLEAVDALGLVQGERGISANLADEGMRRLWVNAVEEGSVSAARVLTDGLLGVLDGDRGAVPADGKAGWREDYGQHALVIAQALELAAVVRECDGGSGFREAVAGSRWSVDEDREEADALCDAFHELLVGVRRIRKLCGGPVDGLFAASPDALKAADGEERMKREALRDAVDPWGFVERGSACFDEPGLGMAPGG